MQFCSMNGCVILENPAASGWWGAGSAEKAGTLLQIREINERRENSIVGKTRGTWSRKGGLSRDFELQATEGQESRIKQRDFISSTTLTLGDDENNPPLPFQ